MFARVARHASRERPVHRRARRRVRRFAGTPIARPALFVDAASLAYRAYRAVPEWRAPDGTLVNAALGFLNFLSRLVPDRKPARLFVALDADWRPQFRVDAMPPSAVIPPTDSPGCTESAKSPRARSWRSTARSMRSWPRPTSRTRSARSFAPTRTTSPPLAEWCGWRGTLR